MSKTIFVNPSILAATLLSAGLASISMGTVTRCALEMETGKGLSISSFRVN